MTGLTLSIILAATLITAFMSSIFGILGGLVLMGVLVSLLPVSAAIVRQGHIKLTSNGYRAWLNRADIEWRIIALFTIGTIVTLAVLSILAFQPDKVTVFLALGLLPYIAAALPKSLALDITKAQCRFLLVLLWLAQICWPVLAGLCSMCFSSTPD